MVSPYLVCENPHQTLMFCTSTAHLQTRIFRADVKQAWRRAIWWFLDHPLWDSLWAAWAMIAVLWLIAAVLLALPLVLLTFLLRYFF